MEDGFAVFRVALARQFREIFAQRGAIAGDDGGQHVIVQLGEETLVAS